ncbi:MAG: hypothetical protein ACRD25_01725, partial [Terracidiphilus sp.]
MEKTSRLKIGATAAAFLLTGTFAVAQTAFSARNSRTLKPRDASSGQASGIVQRKDGAIVHSDYSRRVDERKNGNMGGVDGGSDAAAHAAARSKTSNNAANNTGNKSKTGENPLYERSGNSGTNPLYESKDRLRANAGASNSGSAQKTSADASRKHLGGVKYEDRT